jgi:hypothetical protein
LNAAFHAPVVLLHHIIEVSAGTNPHSLVKDLTTFLQFLYSTMRGSVGIECDGKWITMLQQSMSKQRFRGTHIPALAQEEIHCLAVLVDRPI